MLKDYFRDNETHVAKRIKSLLIEIIKKFILEVSVKNGHYY